MMYMDKMGDSPHPRRYHHRKRVSALHLSSDSIPPLPLYSSPLQPSPWGSRSFDSLPSDQPPDYPDSSEEAHADESESDIQEFHHPYVPPFSGRKVRRLPSLDNPRPRHRRHHSNDFYLDSLLAKSVHALEMSNTLLQSSLSSPSNTFHLSAPSAYRYSEGKARGFLSRRNQNNNSVHETWMDDIEEIGERIDNLVKDEEATVNQQAEDSLSQSLPTSGLAPLAGRHSRRRSSLEVVSSKYHLNYSNHDRSHFVAPAPRAITIYVGSDDDPNAIKLPHTLGSRSTSSLLLYSPPESSTSAKSLDDIPPSEPSPRAYDLLSSYVSSSRSRFSFKRFSRRTSPPPTPSSPTKPRGCCSTSSVPQSPARSLPNPSPTLGNRRGRSLTPLRTEPLSPSPRSITPVIEELSPTSDSSSSDTLHAVKSLRKILDHQTQAEQAKLAQSAPSVSSSASSSAVHLRPPSLLSTNSTKPIASTSHATASVSRLLRKGTHSSSTRPPSPPRHSSLKPLSTPSTPSPSPSHSLLSVPGFFRGNPTTSGNSGRSTPNRVSFAELPESYASSKPGGFSMQFKAKKERKGRKGKERAEVRKKVEDYDYDSPSWWTSWVSGGAASSRQEERAEERAARWGMRLSSPAFGGGVDDWTF